MTEPNLHRVSQFTVPAVQAYLEVLLAYMDHRSVKNLSDLEVLDYERELDFWWDRMTLVEQSEVWKVARMTKMMEFESHERPLN